MKCLRKFKWVKLHRACLPSGKGVMGYWAKLIASAAFRKGVGQYCGYKNPVVPGMWVGGLIGLRSILGVSNNSKALEIMNELEDLGYVSYSYNRNNKKITYQITDWISRCSGPECTDGTVYATEGYGFVGVPRNLLDRLNSHNRKYNESDAWLDLWCHTTYRDYGNAFSFLGPAVQFGKYESVLTLDRLGSRWGWEKTKVWRFFQKYSDTFSLYRLPGSYGCVVYNSRYLDGQETRLPSGELIIMLVELIRMISRKGIIAESDSARMNRMIAWNSCKLIKALESLDFETPSDGRVASVNYNIRAYFSHGRNCKYGRSSIYDCRGAVLGVLKLVFLHFAEKRCVPIRGSPYLLNHNE